MALRFTHEARAVIGRSLRDIQYYLTASGLGYSPCGQFALRVAWKSPTAGSFRIGLEVDEEGIPFWVFACEGADPIGLGYDSADVKRWLDEIVVLPRRQIVLAMGAAAAAVDAERAAAAAEVAAEVAAAAAAATAKAAAEASAAAAAASAAAAAAEEVSEAADILSAIRLETLAIAVAADAAEAADAADAAEALSAIRLESLAVAIAVGMAAAASKPRAKRGRPAKRATVAKRDKPQVAPVRWGVTKRRSASGRRAVYRS